MLSIANARRTLKPELSTPGLYEGYKAEQNFDRSTLCVPKVKGPQERALAVVLETGNTDPVSS